MQSAVELAAMDRQIMHQYFSWATLRHLLSAITLSPSSVSPVKAWT
jgi:hypothetical protein